MKTIKVTIQGTSPLLMHSAQGMVSPTATKNPTRQYDHDKEAEKVAYRNKKTKELYVPSRCLKACIINASSWFKFGKKSAKPIIAGSVFIEPFELGLGTKKYVVDLQPVVVQRQRIIRSRPRLDNWKLSFNLVYNEHLIGDTDLLKHIVEEAGQRVGLLDNRPHKSYGENGCFKIVSWGKK